MINKTKDLVDDQTLAEALHQHSITQCVEELLSSIGGASAYPWKLDSEGNQLWIHPINTDVFQKHGVSFDEVRPRIEQHQGCHYRIVGIRNHTQPCITTCH